MLITCTHCGRQLSLADEKVPNRAFALTCPGCKGRIEVDPTQAAGEQEPEVLIEFDPLPPTRPIDKTLLGGLYPMAGIANLTQNPADGLVSGLKFLGMQEVQEFTDLESVVDAMSDTEIAILLIWMDKAQPPPCEPLSPIHRLPLNRRRRTFVALMAENVRSLDGQVAFYLQVNCLLSSSELRLFPRDLQRALVHHLRLYQYWDHD